MFIQIFIPVSKYKLLREKKYNVPDIWNMLLLLMMMLFLFTRPICPCRAQSVRIRHVVRLQVHFKEPFEAEAPYSAHKILLLDSTNTLTLPGVKYDTPKSEVQYFSFEANRTGQTTFLSDVDGVFKI